MSIPLVVVLRHAQVTWCPQWTVISAVLVVVCYVVVPNVCHCLCAVDTWLDVRSR
jgi:hypothetical protein